MTMSTIVRAAHPDEYSAIGEMTVAAYAAGGALADGDTGYVEALRDAGKRAVEAQLLVAVDATTQEPLGTVTLCRFETKWSEIAQPDEAEIRMLAVTPGAWGHGVADELVRNAMSILRADGIRRAVLVVLNGNEPALRLYQRHGFRRAPERDWEPVPGLLLLAHERQLAATDG